MKLSAAQIEQFKTQGYLVVEGFFNERETAALRADVERLQGLGKLRNVFAGEQTGGAKQNLQLCPLYTHSDLVRALPFVPKVRESVAALIGAPTILHLDQVFLKPAKHGSGTNWHQDNAYFKIADPMKGTAMWVAVHDATVANGTIEVIPEKVGAKLEHGRDPDSDHHIRCYPDETQARPVELKAGGVVFFAYGVPHCTRANRTEKDRAGIAFHFLHADCLKDDLDNAVRPLGTVLNGAECTGGAKEYGVKVEGTWEVEIEKLLTPAVTAR